MEQQGARKPDLVPRRRLEREREARQQAEHLLEEKSRQLYKAQKARDLFLRNINHELRTPMNGILGPAQLLAQAAVSPDVQNLAKVIEDSSAELLALIEALDASVRTNGGLPTTADLAPQGTPLVLIVDDIATNRLVAKAAVEAAGMRTILAENGRIAVEMTREAGPSLILMDIQMPVMDGTEAIRQIRLSPDRCARIPIIVVTADAEPDAQRSYSKLGANGYLTKPINIHALHGLMHDLLDASR